MAVGTKAQHWEFLLPWFMELKELVHPSTSVTRLHSHPVRVGTDVDDWWVHVSVSEDGVRKTTAQLRSIREALLIVGAFAQLHRGVCWQYLQSFSLFTPEAHMNMDDPKFLPRFTVEVDDFFHDGKRPSSSIDVKAAVDAFFSMDALSEDFKQDWARIVEMREQVSRTPIDVRPVELYLIFDFHGDTAPSHEISLMIETIKAMQSRLRERALMNWMNRLHSEPVFSVALIDLFIVDVPLSVDAIDSLREMVDVGVRIGTVRLEPSRDKGLAESDGTEKWRWAWRGLLCSITGRARGDASPLQVRVRELCVPHCHLQEPMLSALFSALVDARGVRGLEIMDEPLVADPALTVAEGELPLRRRPQPETEEERTADEAFWYWMGCVLFQESPSEQSLESITLLSAHIQARVTVLLSTYKAGLIHPLASLAKKVVPHLATSSDGRFAGTSVTIPAGIEVTFHSSIDRDTETLTTPGPIEATLIQQDSQEWSSAVVLIPGLGICSVDARLLSPKRQHIVVEPPQRLLIIPTIRNFVIFRRRGRVQDGSVLETFVGLIGDSLEGLGLRIPTLTVLHLYEILAKCPNLRSISVGWASLSSLDFLFNAYDSG